MENTSCANCQAAFEVREKGYQRYSLESKLSRCQVTGLQALACVTSAQFTLIKSKRKENFLCPSCWVSLSNTYLYQRASDTFWKSTLQTGCIARKLQSKEDVAAPSTSTPAKEGSSPKVRKVLFGLSSVKPQRRSKLNRITNAVRRRKFTTALRHLYNTSPASKRQYHSSVKTMVQREVKILLKSSICLTNQLSVDNLSKFSWNEVLDSVDQFAPVLSSTLRSVVTTKSEESTLERGKRKKVNLKPHIGNSLACLLHVKSPRKSNLLQTIRSLQFWQGGLKRETINQLSHLGICLGYQSTLNAIDKIRAEFDTGAKVCKAEIESQLDGKPIQQPPKGEESQELSFVICSEENIEEELYKQSDEDNETPCTSESDEKSKETSTDDDSESMETPSTKYMDVEEETGEEEQEEEGDVTFTDIRDPEGESELHPGFTLCWDNVGKKVVTRHPQASTSNLYINVALAYLTINRIPSTHLDNTPQNNKLASDIPLDVFIPNGDDFQEVKQRMSTPVGRIITRHLKWFAEHFMDCVVRHIIHPHSVESAQRSVMVNLGVFDENPSSTQGAIGIYRRLLDYIPNIDGKPYATVVFGDGLSYEMGNDALKARCNGLNAWDWLEGLEPSPQEFHKEMILLQDHYDEFFRGSSAGEKGTLFHLKNLCNFRNIKLYISDSVSHCWELMAQSTEAHVTIMAMQEMGLASRDDTPSLATAVSEWTVPKKKDFFETFCHRIVAKLWHKMDTDTLKRETQEGGPVYCCDDDLKDENFIGCESRHKCLSGEWFHYTCANVDPESIPHQWFCSDTCQDQDIVVYCYCRQNIADEPMIGCSAEDICSGNEWYHYKCVGITKESVPEGTWYCSEACKEICTKKSKPKKAKLETVPSAKDHKFLHSLAITWSGLNLLCRRDAVREADGDAMMSHWLIDLVHFFRKRHVKYVILAHRLIVSMNGWVSEKVQQDLRWNRTVNYSGGIGRNLPADLTNEFLNRLFKELLKDAHGQYTHQTWQVVAKLLDRWKRHWTLCSIPTF